MIDLASEVPDLAPDENNIRAICLDMRSLNGASENSYEVWAGPPSMGLPSEVNARVRSVTPASTAAR